MQNRDFPISRTRFKTRIFEDVDGVFCLDLVRPDRSKKCRTEIWNKENYRGKNGFGKFSRNFLLSALIKCYDYQREECQGKGVDLGNGRNLRWYDILDQTISILRFKN